MKLAQLVPATKQYFKNIVFLALQKRGCGCLTLNGKISLFLLLLLISGIFPQTSHSDEELDFGLETHRVAQISVRGNFTFSEEMLKGLLHIQEPTWKRPLNVPTYQPHLVATQLRLLANFYRARGFHQVSVRLDTITNIPDRGDVIHIIVEEGERTLIRNIGFEGNGPIDTEILMGLLVLKPGKPAPASLNSYGVDIYSIRNVYRNATYLGVTILPEVTIGESASGSGFYADVVYKISSGRPYVVRNITLSGNETTEANLLTRELVISEGQPMQWSKIESSRRRLLGTSLFRDVNIVPVSVDTTLGLADLEIRVIEGKPAYYELGVGLGSEERVRVLAAWGHRNLWGTGRTLRVLGRTSWNVEDVVGNPISFYQGQMNYRADILYSNPRLRNSRYSFNTNIFVKRETRGESGLNMKIYGFRVGSSWKASRRVTNDVYLGLKVTNPELHPLAPADTEERFADVGVNKSHTRSLNWAIFIDHRNDLFQPESGMYTIGTAQFTGGFLGGDYSFLKWSAAWHNYHRTPLGGVLALRVMFGGARPFGSSLDLGSDGVPYDDRFFAGGSSTVRGYRHNSLGPQVTDPDEIDYLNYTSDVLLPDNPARGGNYLMLSNVEWRFPIPVLKRWNLASVFFFEGGNTWSNISGIRMRSFRLTSEPGDPGDPTSTKTWDYRYSIGTGIRLITPFGPVRVDVGFPLKRARYLSESKNTSDPKSVWHFSLGYPF